jgi:regulatory protein
VPIITDIKKQKKSDTRFSVFIDDQYAFALTDLELSTSGLRVGQHIDTAQRQELEEAAGESKLYYQALRYLSYRMRSRREMADHLHGKGADDDDVAAVIERLEQSGLINDEAFAEAWIRQRQALRPRSRRMLEQELMQKGIDRDSIAQALVALEPEEELATLVQQIERKRRLAQYADREKLIAFFARQGYSYALVKRALEQIEAD